ncbi:hypothetical protein [Ottowia testudinis]|uniref:Uncharacterized protein n=1 Tax=Ottowia testudinis TaxID=2816950 RepID=A0A975CKQ8_9BURK|nr:hypothetical protein [Ottowia testudinis]QTD45989.1 hypothetical protein J1M35_03500 [Ottowia testudinis]
MNPNPIDQTRLSVAAIAASLIQSLEDSNPGLTERFVKNLEAKYQEIRDYEVVHTGTLETLKWTRDFLKS